MLLTDLLNYDPAPFTIDPITGVVNVSRPLDISESEQYDLQVEAFDGNWKSTVRIICGSVFFSNRIIALLSQATLKVYVREANERDPRFDQLHYRFAVEENRANVLVGRVELKPRKFRVNSQMVYSIVNTEMRSLFKITSV